MSAPGQQSARATLLTKLLDPWTPDIDVRRNDKPCIIAGRNFRDMVDGPASAWANEFVNFNNFDSSTRGKINDLRITNGFLYGTQTGVYKVNASSGLLEPLLVTPYIAITQPYWPWTIAYVGGVYYFAQYDIGLWQYNDVAETLTKVTTPFTAVRGVAADHGRLIVLSDTVVAISALDDGTNFTPDLASAASAQPLSLVGGMGYKIEVVDDGFLVYMSKGILRGTWTTNAFVYSYDKFVVSKVFTPNATCYIPGLGIIDIDNNGMWLTNSVGQAPQAWDVEKSDYFKRNILAFMDENLYGTIFMYYSQALQVLFIAFSSNLIQGLFQTTFCWDMVSKRWSSFDQFHYGIFETYDQINNQYSCSFMDTAGYMHRFVEQNFTESVPELPLQLSDFVYRPLATDDIVRVVTDPARNGGVAFHQGNTEILSSDANAFWYSNYTLTGVYSINAGPYSDTVTTTGDPDMNVSGSPIIGYTNIDMFSSGGIELIALPYILPEIGLDSYVELGPWRFNTQQSFAEEVSCVESLMLGVNNVNGFQIFEDWNALDGDEDWNSLSGAEDWSSGAAFPNIYELSLLTSDDGFTTPLQGIEELDIFIDKTSSQLYKPNGWNGVYHSIKISAQDVGDCYNIKLVDFTGNLTGTLLSDTGT